MNLIRLRLKVPVLSPGQKDDRLVKLNAILGPRGIRGNEFLKMFDTQVKDFNYSSNTILIVHLDAKIDKNNKVLEYKHEIGTPTISSILKKKIGISKFSSKPGVDPIIASVDRKIMEEVVMEKYNISKDDIFFNAKLSMAIGSLRSYGVKYLETK